MIFDGLSYFRYLVNRNLNAVLTISVVIGLFFPGIESVPDIYVPYILGVMVFFLCAKMSIKEIHHLPVCESLLFYGLRFIGFPLVLYYLALATYPQFAAAILLVALMPVGVTTPALVGTLKGNVALAFVLTILSSLLAPIVIPAVFMVAGSSSKIEIESLAYTLFAVIFIPAAVYTALIRIKPASSEIIEQNSAFVPVLLLGVIIAIVIAKQKHVFFEDFFQVAEAAVLCSVLFFLMYLFGWFYRRKNSNSRLITYALCSGANNNALAISLALVYFSPETVFFVIVSELIWVVAIPVFNTCQTLFLKDDTDVPELARCDTDVT